MGDAKGAEKYFQDLIYKARKNKSDNLAHFLVNNGLVNIQLVRVIIIKLFVKSYLMALNMTIHEHKHLSSFNCRSSMM